MTPLPKIAAPAIRALDSIGVKHLEDLADHSEQQILSLHGFGKNGMMILKDAMREHGIQFKN